MKQRIAVIGTGWWATEHHIPSLLANPRAELVAAVDTDAHRLERALDRFPIPTGYTDLQEMIAHETLHGVIIATPHNTHYSLARVALEAGLHTFVEKPLTVSPDHAWHLVELARAKCLHLTVGYTGQHQRSAQHLRRVVHDGDLGKLLAVDCTVATSFHALLMGDMDRFAQILGIDDTRPSPTTYSDPERAGGGYMQSQLTHTVGMLLYITGRSPTRVFAATATGDLDMDLCASITFDLSGGVIGGITGVGTVERPQREIHTLRYFGSRAYAIQDLLAGSVTIIDNDGAEQKLRPPQRSEPHPKQSTCASVRRPHRGKRRELRPRRRRRGCRGTHLSGVHLRRHRSPSACPPPRPVRDDRGHGHAPMTSGPKAGAATGTITDLSRASVKEALAS